MKNLARPAVFFDWRCKGALLEVLQTLATGVENIILGVISPSSMSLERIRVM
jgi:hypothetical protein